MPKAKGPSAAEARDALLRALELAGMAKAGPTARSVTPMPTAKAARAAERLGYYGTLEALMAENPDVKALVSDVLNWQGPKATKAVAKTAAQAMMSKRDNGASCYPQVVEIVSLAATVAPLLQPDRLARIIAQATEVPSAYAPIGSQLTSTALRMRRLLGHYSEERIEKLIISLWKGTHNGRWWDDLAPNLQPRMNANEPNTRTIAGRIAAQHDRRLLESATETALAELGGQTDMGVLSALIEHRLAYNEETVGRLRAIRMSPELAARMGLIAQLSHPDPDVAVLWSQLADLSPAQRPPSPIPHVLEMLETIYVNQAAAQDVEVNFKELLPEKPTEWEKLYPPAALQIFPIPEFMRELHGMLLPGTGEEAGNMPAVIELVRSTEALYANAEYMGNCIAGNNGSCLAGNGVVGRILRGRRVFNFYLSGRADNPHGWVMQELNAKANQAHTVPEEVKRGLREIVTARGWEYRQYAYQGGRRDIDEDALEDFG